MYKLNKDQQKLFDEMLGNVEKKMILDLSERKEISKPELFKDLFVFYSAIHPKRKKSKINKRIMQSISYLEIRGFIFIEGYKIRLVEDYKYSKNKKNV